MIWREFKAMGTDIVITADLENEQAFLLKRAEDEIINFEKRFSRFIVANELAKFNECAGGDREVSLTMAEMLKKIKFFYLKTHGIFDPTIINNLEAIGYNESFDQIIKKEVSREIIKLDFKGLVDSFKRRSPITSLKIIGKTVNIPTGFRIDLGGIGKGYIVDKLSKKLFSTVKNYWISAGGDIFVKGNYKNNEGWDIGVQNPYQLDKNIFFLNNRGKELGIATSGIIKRKGKSGGSNWNHIIDPRTGLSVDNNVLSVTAISPETVSADVFAKTILILGEREGLRFIDKTANLAAIIFTKDKKIIFSKQARLYLKNL